MAKTSLPAGSAAPLYQQIKQQVRQAIVRGEHQPGDRLPSEPELMQRFGVSRITVRQAIGDLETEGLVVRRHGRGTFVVAPPIAHDLLRLTDFDEDMRAAGLSPATRVLAHRQIAAPPLIAGALELAPNTPVDQIDRLRLANGQPVALDVTWLPAAYATLLERADLERETILQYLETRYQLTVEQGDLTISAAGATTDQARWLDVPVGAALLSVVRLARLGGGQPLYRQARWYRPDRAHYQVLVQRGVGGHGGTEIQTLRPLFAAENAS